MKMSYPLLRVPKTSWTKVRKKTKKITGINQTLIMSSMMTTILLN